MTESNAAPSTAAEEETAPVSETSRFSKRSIGLAALAVALIAGTIGFGVGRLQRCETPTASVAHTWNENLLDAIRRDFPAPTVHARNLYHLSAAMWDVWAAYEPEASAVYLSADRTSGGSLSDEAIEQERSEAISYAAHTLLSRRYDSAVGGEASVAQFDQTMADLCYDIDDDPVADSAAAFGVEVATTILVETRRDGSLEASGYVDLSYAAVNEPLPVAESGTTMEDPNRWQPLSLGQQITQNGQVLPAGIQEFVGPNWGFVEPFALEPDPENGLPFDPGAPPLLGVDDEEFAARASEVVTFSALLDVPAGRRVDISPGTLGNTELGTRDARGWDTNPTTGEPYAPNEVPEADFGRVVAEYWADGPDSETPPGHWNTLAHEVADQLEAVDALVFDGDPVDRLEWDVKMGLALNGALHDAAIGAWGAKAYYDYVRPISMIRYLGVRGELAEIPGVVETITAESAMPGERHVHLSDYIGEQAVYSWRGESENPDVIVSGVAWIRAADWVPYQRASFVTPAFAGYVSGHSTFSRAAAEVLTEFTGSPYFPGGLATHTVEPGGLIHEAGPTETIELQWATYRDAADQAGISRLYGGIHVWADDVEGRRMGAEIGVIAVDHARTFFN